MHEYHYQFSRDNTVILHHLKVTYPGLRNSEDRGRYFADIPSSLSPHDTEALKQLLNSSDATLQHAGHTYTLLGTVDPKSP